MLKLNLKIEDDVTLTDIKGTPFEALAGIQAAHEHGFPKGGKVHFRGVAYRPEPDYEFTLDHADQYNDLTFTMLPESEDPVESIEGEDAQAFFKRANAEGLEVGLTSIAEVGGRKMAVPLIDFKPGLADLQAHGLLVSSQSYTGLYVRAWKMYATGASAHAYGTHLYDDFHDYLAKVLLLRSNNDQPLVDTRWVGHALARGYATLRLTCNNKMRSGHMYSGGRKRYAQVPSAIENPFLKPSKVDLAFKDEF